MAALCFAMQEALPGDMAFRIAAARYDAERVTAAATEEVRRDLGLDQPAWRRFARWLGAAATGELGRSAVSGRPVTEVIGPPLARTGLLVAATWPAAAVLGVAMGSLLSRSRRGVSAANALGALAAGTPSYVLGLALGSVFAIRLGWLPVAGYGGAAHLVLPAATLAALGGTRLALVTARAAAAAAGHPSVAFARMKAVGPGRVAALHVLPLAAPAIVGYAFVSLAFLLEGAAVIETVFAYPGLGRLLVDAVQARDVPVVQGAAAIIALLVVTARAIA